MDLPWSRPISLGEMVVYPLWFDSLGAKASALLVETPDLRILVDPGAAEMQPSFPLGPEDRRRYRERALGVMREAAQGADLVFISHYHYDHHTLPLEAPDLYAGKVLWIKDPNRFINRSQWERSRLFYEQLCRVQGLVSDGFLQEPGEVEADLSQWPTRRPKDRQWIKGLTELWRRGPWLKEGEVGDVEVRFADGVGLRRGRTSVRFTEPLFHGGEYDRVGWVVALVVEVGGRKLLYSSDIQGPVIEAYARWIVEERPELLVLDGPPTYLLGYLFGQRDMERALVNAEAILQGLEALIIYDHHLPRDPRFRERTARLWKLAGQKGREFLTCAEWFGMKPLVLELTEAQR